MIQFIFSATAYTPLTGAARSRDFGLNLLIGIQAKAFFAVIIHDSQDPELFAIEKLAGNKIHAPDLMHSRCIDMLETLSC